MCINLIEWFNEEFLFMFESNKFKKYKETNTNELSHNIKIIIDEPKISPSDSKISIETNYSISKVETPSSIELISNDKYDLYTWDIL